MAMHLFEGVYTLCEHNTDLIQNVCPRLHVISVGLVHMRMIYTIMFEIEPDQRFHNVIVIVGTVVAR